MHAQADKPRSKAQTLTDLRAQAERVFSGAPSTVDTMATDMGTKDKYFQHFVDDLQEKLNKWHNSHKTVTENSATQSSTSCARQQQELLQKLHEDLPKSLFNLVLDIPGLSASVCTLWCTILYI